MGMTFLRAGYTGWVNVFIFRYATESHSNAVWMQTSRHLFKLFVRSWNVSHCFGSEYGLVDCILWRYSRLDFILKLLLVYSPEGRTLGISPKCLHAIQGVLANT